MVDSPLIPGSPAPRSQCHHKHPGESCGMTDLPISLCVSLTDRQTEMLPPLSWGVAAEQSIKTLQPWHRAAEGDIRSHGKRASGQ